MIKEEKSVRIQSARSFLFTPGDQPHRIQKALSLNCDAVIIDLEDAVRSEQKESARDSLGELLREERNNGPLVFIRVNSYKSSEFKKDVEVAITHGVDGIVIPKFISGNEVFEVDRFMSKVENTIGRQSQTPVIGLVETSAGILQIIAHPDFPTRVKRLALGLADLAADLGATRSSENASAIFSKAAILMVSAHQGLGSPIDSPYFDINDEENLRRSSLESHELGFGGRLCIHPKQVEVVNESFRPSSEEREWAKKVIDKWNSDGNQRGAIQFEESLIDEAMIKRARRILDLM